MLQEFFRYIYVVILHNKMLKCDKLQQPACICIAYKNVEKGRGFYLWTKKSQLPFCFKFSPNYFSFQSYIQLIHYFTAFPCYSAVWGCP